jgi:uncharacterized membrane protein YhaH (DUF805 family)
MTDIPPPPSYGGSPQPMGNPLVGYWKRVVLERYAQFTGRAARPEFWWYFLANLIISIVFNILVRVSGIFWILDVIYILAVLIPGLAVGVRRLHDTDKSGWWLLIALVPLVGIIVLLVFFATEGTRGPNRYGAPDQV